MEKEDLLLLKHLSDLAEKSYRNNMFTFSGFLSLTQQDILAGLLKEHPYMHASLFGGNDACERKMVRFGNSEELRYEEAFPIVCIHIKPLIEKFADTFTHRDFLGAIMNLGIERDTVGDIFLKEKTAYVYCQEKIAPYIMNELDQVKHTHISCETVSGEETQLVKEPVSKEIIVSSTRIDGVVAKVYHLSRSQSIELFRAKRVFVNGRTQENNSYFVKPQDSITVRGFGKFDFLGEVYHTKKDRLCIAIAKYE